jgi:hypothetical protein
MRVSNLLLALAMLLTPISQASAKVGPRIAGQARADRLKSEIDRRLSRVRGLRAAVRIDRDQLDRLVARIDLGEYAQTPETMAAVWDALHDGGRATSPPRQFRVYTDGVNQPVFYTELNGVVPRIGDTRDVGVEMGYATSFLHGTWLWEHEFQQVTDIHQRWLTQGLK